jgi:hypothetical protein
VTQCRIDERDFTCPSDPFQCVTKALMRPRVKRARKVAKEKSSHELLTMLNLVPFGGFSRRPLLRSNNRSFRI